MIHRIARLLALLALFVALLDAARLLGIGAPIVDLAGPKGAISFGALGVLTLGRLFSGVGIWIESNWGNVLLLITSILELIAVVFGVAQLDISLFGWMVRLLLLAGVLYLILYGYWHWRRAIHD